MINFDPMRVVPMVPKRMYQVLPLQSNLEMLIAVIYCFTALWRDLISMRFMMKTCTKTGLAMFIDSSGEYCLQLCFKD